MSDRDYSARELDAGRPSAARIYHYLLSGEPIFEIDRVHAEQMARIAPDGDVLARHNRSFLQRAVTFMARRGVRQFLDIGSGLPTAGNTHEVACAVAPGSRVVYVDYDLEAVNRSYELLAAQGALGTATVLEADLRDPKYILDHPDVARLISHDLPVGLLVVAVWHFVPDSDRPLEVMATLREWLPAGSCVAMSHLSLEDVDPAFVARAAAGMAEYNRVVSNQVTPRTRATFTEFFDGFALVEPGIVYAPDWRPTTAVDPGDVARQGIFAGVGIKP
ncbi:SAM-dependent methyltransferase [Nocardia sp. BMG111209]|uniref:SAM-dependent methyltransferase n=1 Tax=Nocardia sp. BMG111209 TaxID=1160137 RepID=UPI000375F9B9|nr:SAM-dependent methyltransferase [Nocardia sp. BMG111209]